MNAIHIYIPAILFVAMLSATACTLDKNSSETPQRAEVPVTTGNPFIPGDFADPCVVQYRDTFYVYATSGSEATVWFSADFVNWKLEKLNWPTNMELPDIWAPAVRQAPNGKFYFYPSVNHDIYVGVADHPKGQFKNILGGDSIFIENRQWWDKMHSIDADCFIDDDGQAYIYWGSGFDFKDGICAVGILGDDMASFESEPELVTPHRYFEAPHMIKRDSTYYLMYSDSLYYDSTYKVHYAVSNSPLGPFEQGKNNPILKSTPDGRISGPGHHYTMQAGSETYIVYHRHAIPYYRPHGGSPIRQVCIDKLNFEDDGSISRVEATDNGVDLDFTNVKDIRMPYEPVETNASSNNGGTYIAESAFDNQYGTLWSAPNEGEATLTADYGAEFQISEIQPIFDLPMAPYRYRIETSLDSVTWIPYAEGNNGSADQWPVSLRNNTSARYVRISVSDPSGALPRLGIWELKVF